MISAKDGGIGFQFLKTDKELRFSVTGKHVRPELNEEEEEEEANCETLEEREEENME